MSASNNSIDPIVSGAAAARVANQVRNNKNVPSDASVATFNKLMSNSATPSKNIDRSTVTMEEVKDLINESVVRSGIRRLQYIQKMRDLEPKIGS